MGFRADAKVQFNIATCHIPYFMKKNKKITD